MYLLKLALRSWKMAPFSQLFSIAAVGILLVLVGFTFWVQRALTPVVNRLHGEQVITAYLDPALERKDEKEVVDSIRLAIGSQALNELKLLDSAGFIANVKSQYPDLGSELEGLGTEAERLIPRYVSVSGLFGEAVLGKIRAVKGIESAESSKDRYRHVVGAFKALRWVARILALGLFVALMTGLFHLSRINAYLHQDAIGLLKLWGATDLTLRAPGVISGLMIGFAGGALAFLGWLGGGSWLAYQIRGLSPMLSEMPAPSPSMGFILLILGAALGLLAGLAASAVAPPASAEAGG